MSKHAEGYRKRDMHSGIPSEEYTAGYELAFPQQSDAFMSCGHRRSWADATGMCTACVAEADGAIEEWLSRSLRAETRRLAEEFEVGPRFEGPASAFIPGLAPDTSPPGLSLVVTQVDQERGTVTLEASRNGRDFEVVEQCVPTYSGPFPYMATEVKRG